MQPSLLWFGLVRCQHWEGYGCVFWYYLKSITHSRWSLIYSFFLWITCASFGQSNLPRSTFTALLGTPQRCLIEKWTSRTGMFRRTDEKMKINIIYTETSPPLASEVSWYYLSYFINCNTGVTNWATGRWRISMGRIRRQLQFSEIHRLSCNQSIRS